MDKQDLIYDIVCRLERKMDTRLDKNDDRMNKIEDKVDTHTSSPHTVSLSAKQITAITGALSIILGTAVTITKIIVG